MKGQDLDLSLLVLQTSFKAYTLLGLDEFFS